MTRSRVHADRDLPGQHRSDPPKKQKTKSDTAKPPGPRCNWPAIWPKSSTERAHQPRARPQPIACVPEPRGGQPKQKQKTKFDTAKRPWAQPIACVPEPRGGQPKQKQKTKFDTAKRPAETVQEQKWEAPMNFVFSLTPRTIANRIMSGPLPAPRLIRPGLPSLLEDVCVNLLAHDPLLRLPSLQPFIQTLDVYLSS